MNENEKPRDRKMIVGQYMVAVFDVLGQKKKLEKQRGMVMGEVPENQLLQTFKDTAGVVLACRERFKGFFKNARKNSGLAYRLPEPQRSQMLAALSSNIVCWGVSDATYVGVPLARTRHPAACVGDVFASLGAAASIWLIGLRANQPIRGGMEIGWGVDVGPEEIYGLALLDAIYLESKVAQLPRIVVGPGCVEFLEDIGKATNASELELRLAAGQARQCLSMLRKDTDGRVVVHGLGPVLREVFAAPGIGEHVSEAHENVRANCERFAGDEKLAPRYKALLEYFDKYAPEWYK